MRTTQKGITLDQDQRLFVSMQFNLSKDRIVTYCGNIVHIENEGGPKTVEEFVEIGKKIFDPTRTLNAKLKLLQPMRPVAALDAPHKYGETQNFTFDQTKLMWLDFGQRLNLNNMRALVCDNAHDPSKVDTFHFGEELKCYRKQNCEESLLTRKAMINCVQSNNFNGVNVFPAQNIPSAAAKMSEPASLDVGGPAQGATPPTDACARRRQIPPSISRARHDETLAVQPQPQPPRQPLPPATAAAMAAIRKRKMSLDEEEEERDDPTFDIAKAKAEQKAAHAGVLLHIIISKLFHDAVRRAQSAHKVSTSESACHTEDRPPPWYVSSCKIFCNLASLTRPAAGVAAAPAVVPAKQSIPPHATAADDGGARDNYAGVLPKLCFVFFLFQNKIVHAERLLKRANVSPGAPAPATGAHRGGGKKSLMPPFQPLCLIQFFVIWRR